MSRQPLEAQRRTPKDSEIPALLDALGAAGGNTAAFARERGLTPWKLYKARRERDARRARDRKRSDREEFVRVEWVDAERTGEAPLELVLEGVGRLRIPADFDEVALRRVIGVLRSC